MACGIRHCTKQTSHMENLKALEAMGLVLPSPLYILGAVLFGLVGIAAFRRGRKLSRPALTWTGAGLMFYPYVVPQTWLLWLVGAVLTAWMYLKWE